MNEANEELLPHCNGVKITRKNIEVFFSRIDQNGPLPDQSKPYYAGLDKCHIWTGGKIAGGYGDFSHLEFRTSAHRMAWIIRNGEIPKGYFVMHLCDNPACVNPDHLTIGTPADNCADRDSKGRTAKGDRSGARRFPERVARGDRHGSKTFPDRVPRGEKNGMWKNHEKAAQGTKHPKAKMNDEMVRDARKLREIGAKLSEVAWIFDISIALAHKITTRQTWRHVE